MNNKNRNPEPPSDGYELVEGYDPLGDGTPVFMCPECGAVKNADDRHLEDCSRRPRLPE